MGNECSCSCPISIFVPVNVGHEHSLMMAQSLSWVEKHSCDNSVCLGRQQRCLSLSSSRAAGKLLTAKWFEVENSAL